MLFTMHIKEKTILSHITINQNIHKEIKNFFCLFVTKRLYAVDELVLDQNISIPKFTILLSTPKLHVMLRQEFKILVLY